MGGKPTWKRVILAGETYGTPHVVGILAESLPMWNGRETQEEMDGKNILAAEQTLISNLYLCLGRRGQEELHKRRPHLELGEARYPRVLDAMEGEFKKERNETYEVFQLLSRKQRIEESLEQFHAVFSGLAARCSFGHWSQESYGTFSLSI